MNLYRLTLLLTTLVLYGPMANAKPQQASPQNTPDRKPNAASTQSVLTVDTSKREETRNFYNGVYRAASDSLANWQGDIRGCEAGSIASEYQGDTLLRVNYYRAMAGVPATVTFNPDYNSSTQAAALMMSANAQLSHHPPESWFCYTAAGANAAASSNLALGSSGPVAVDNLMYDWGDNNAAVGHRRWILFPNTRVMGSGSVEPAAGSDYSSSMVLWVMDPDARKNARPITRDAYISWPPKGFVPKALLPDRWSFSYPDADFTGATVTVESGGNVLNTQPEPLASGFGDNTLVWITDFSTAETPGDTTYKVTVDNVLIKNEPTRFEYEVMSFDPAQTGKDTVLPEIQKAPLKVAVGAKAAYTLRKVQDASDYEWNAIRTEAYTTVNDAESGLGDLQNAPETATYPLISKDVHATGQASYHLAQTDQQTHTLALQGRFVPGTRAQLQFASRLGWATTEQAADVDISIDDGRTWKTLYHQSGTNTGGEQNFSQKTVDLSAYANRLTQLRFHYGSEQHFYYQTDPGVGWYLDDIRLQNVTRVAEKSTPNSTSTNRFVFTPTVAGNYFLTTRAVIFGQYPLEWTRLKAVKVK